MNATSAPAAQAADRADQLLAMASRLTTLVAAEIEAMKQRRLDGASADWSEKETLAHGWRVEIGRIKADPSLLAGLDAGRKLALREAAQTLEATLETHAAALAAMKDVTEGLVRAIAGEVASARSAPTGYGRSGQIAAEPRREASGLAVDAKV